MLLAYSPAQVVAADRHTIESGTPVEVLMDRAGRALARTARRLLGGTYGRRAVLLCGKGNNGGDGLVAARVLRRWGVDARVHRLDGLDRVACERDLRRADLAVDAMFGTGFRGALEGGAAWAAAAMAELGVPVLAADVPSGVDGSTGAVEGAAVDADHTLCFGALKTGLLLFPGAAHAGSLDVADIGLDLSTAGRPVEVFGEADVASLLPEPPPESHKWRTALMVVAGSAGMLGAARFVTAAAARTGSGMVVLGVPGEELARRAGGREVVVRPLGATVDGWLDEPAAKEVLDGLDRFRALAVGPGLGTEDATVTAVRRLVAEAAVPTLVDADGLNALAGDLAAIRDRRAPTVLTPHDGEFARLAGAPPGVDRIGAVTRLAAGTGAVVLLKGSRTIVADPDGRVAVNTTGGPWLATAGTGDVLSGVVSPGPPGTRE